MKCYVISGLLQMWLNAELIYIVDFFYCASIDTCFYETLYILLYIILPLASSHYCGQSWNVTRSVFWDVYSFPLLFRLYDVIVLFASLHSSHNLCCSVSLISFPSSRRYCFLRAFAISLKFLCQLFNVLPPIFLICFFLSSIILFNAESSFYVIFCRLNCFQMDSPTSWRRYDYITWFFYVL